MSKKEKRQQKIRTEFRKNYGERTRTSDLTREFEQHGFEEDESARSERVSGKGELTKKRTVIGAHSEDGSGFDVHREVDESTCSEGRVISVHGLESTVELADGTCYQCTIRGVLKTLSTDQRHVVVAGDYAQISITGDNEGVIERIEPRRGLISRTSRGRQHVIVVNVDQLLIVASAAEPVLKPNLIDRFLITAEKTEINPIICINKIDLVDPADLQPLAGVYGQMGYDMLLLSAKTGFGMNRLAQFVSNKDSVVVGQSGVGKSSLLNVIDPTLHLRVSEVSADNQKGKHTTTTARLIRLATGGYVVDTPGIRQFQLWDVIPEEVEGFFRDLRPFISHCRYPDCTHTHETECAVKDAVADGHLDTRRYESYCQMFDGDAV